MATQTPNREQIRRAAIGDHAPATLRELGLEYVPAVPVDIGDMADTLSNSLSGSSSASRPSRASPRRSRSADRPPAPITSSSAEQRKVRVEKLDRSAALRFWPF